MFSSPSRGSIRRRQGGGPGSSIRAGTPSGRASTPLAAQPLNRRRTESVASFDAGSEVTFRSNVSTNRRGKARTEGAAIEGAILSRDEIHAVTVLCRLPIEINEALQRLGTYDPCFCELDAETGFAYLTTSDKCYTWSLGSRGVELPPCYVLEHPSSPSSSTSSSVTVSHLPFCKFISRGQEKEPGLVCVAPDGNMWYCDNVVSSLGGKKFVKMSLPVGAGEAMTQVYRCTESLFLATTTQSRIFSIRFSASGGTLQAQISPFAQSKGIFGRLFGAPAQLTQNRGLSKVCSLPSITSKGALDVYFMGETVLQKWSVAERGGERLLLEEDLTSSLRDLISNVVARSSSAQSFSLVDIVGTSHDKIAVLFSFAVSPGGPLHYHVALLDNATTAAAYPITSSFALEYTRYKDVRPHSDPRLLIPYGGPIAFIVFPEAIIAKLLDGKAFEEVIQMRNVATNRIIGYGAEGLNAKRADGVTNLSVVTAISGALLVEIDTQQAFTLDYQLSSGSDKTQVQTRRLKSRLERGVFHSSSHENPVSFEIPKENDGDLVSAVEQLSEEIVSSKSLGLSNSIDLRVQLADRLEKLHGMASFLASDERIRFLPQDSLRRLCSDAELVAAAIDVWDLQNARSNTTSAQDDVLSVAITSMEKRDPDASYEGDVVRAFFRSRLPQLPAVLQRLQQIIGNQSGHSLIEQSSNMITVNSVLLAAVQAAYRYRAEADGLYHLDLAKCSVQAWTCTTEVVESLFQQYRATSELLQDRKRRLGNSMDEDGPNTSNDVDGIGSVAGFHQYLSAQLCDLASSTLDVFEERIAYLKAASVGNVSTSRELQMFQDQYTQVRAEVLLGLVDIGRMDRAIHLAERHKDFPILSQLCCSLQGESQTSRIRAYLRRYQHAFANALYDHYLREGESGRMLEEEGEFQYLVSDYLSSRPELNRLGWLHDINLREWDAASKKLGAEAEREVASLGSKNLMLSLCKITLAAQYTEGDVASVTGQQKIESIDDQLDLLKVHQKLCGELQETDGQAIDVEEMLDNVTQIRSAISPAFAKLYCQLARRLCEGQVLSCEDLIDLLMLPDASDVSIEHYNTAIEVYVRAKDIPQARLDETLASIWRRVLLHDDWLELTDTTTKSISDSVLIARMKKTALYQVDANASGNKATAEAILNPVDCLLGPSRQSLVSRFAAAAAEEDSNFIDALEADYEAEVQRASETVEAGAAKGWFDDVFRLVKQDRDQKQDETMREEDSPFISMY